MSDPSAQSRTNAARNIISAVEILKADLVAGDRELAQLRTEYRRLLWIVTWFEDIYPMQLIEAREYAARMTEQEERR